MNGSDFQKPLALDFLDTTQSSQMINVQPVSTNTNPIDTKLLLASGEQLWQTKGKLNLYQKGVFLGKGTSSNLTLEEFLKKFRKLLEEIVRDELTANNQTSENYKDLFKGLEALFNMLITYLELMNIELKNSNFLPVVHGFIDSYINSIINLERNG